MKIRPTWTDVVQLAIGDFCEATQLAAREELLRLAEYLDVQRSGGFDGLLIEPGCVGLEEIPA